MAKYSTNGTSCTVEKGDTLWGISKELLKKELGRTPTDAEILDKVNYIADKNDIENKDLIYVDQVLILSGTGVVKKTNTSSKANVKHFGYQSNSNGVLFAVWQWDKANTKEYTVLWEYTVGDGFWWEGEKTTIAHPTKQDMFNIPSNAERVRFRVKPIAKTRKVNKKDVAYWTALWSTTKTYDVSNNPPGTPGKPTIVIDDDCKLTASVSLSNLNAKIIQFQVYQQGETDKVVKSGKANVANNVDGKGTHSWVVTPGYKYFVKCRAYNNGQYSDWSDASEPASTPPPTPANLKQVEFIYTYTLLTSTEAPDGWSTGGYKSYYVQTTTEDGTVVFEAVKGLFDVNGIELGAPGYEANKYYSTEQSTQLKLSWPAVLSADYYDIQYSENSEVFGNTSAEPTLVSTKDKEPSAITDFTIDGVDSTKTYYVRYRAVTEDGKESKWSEIANTTGGTGPAAPTTWSSATVAVIRDENDENTGEIVKLYWLHNSSSGSKQTCAILRLYIESFGQSLIVEKEYKYDKDADPNGVKFHEINTASEEYKAVGGSGDPIPINYENGAKIEWCVRTAGESGGLSDWSATRVVYLYRHPSLDLTVTYPKDDDDTLTAFPINISTKVHDDAIQTPIGYHISIVANEGYDTIDNVGNYKRVNAGDQIYSKYFDDLQEMRHETDENNAMYYQLDQVISGGDVTLENNASYTVKCSVTMDSGLSDSQTVGPFTVGLADSFYEPNAEMFLDEDSYALQLKPYCEDENGALPENIKLSVYRREFDGKFTEIGSNIDNNGEEFIKDPHPALDFGRYRIVAKNATTGEVHYTDMPDFPINCDAAIIQWDETWKNLRIMDEDVIPEPTWSGSMIKLPYNIDISEDSKPEVSLVKYIGRENPVGYYGTQLGTTSNWSLVIPADDVDTLYQLRRLAVYTGDVYVRAPSGLGYWANVNVSLSDKHTEVTIPVTISVTRVEGGV